ncbi:MAG: hypothetical protein QXW84_07380, partial [Archaeoglobaceae archaeon]
LINKINEIISNHEKLYSNNPEDSLLPRIVIDPSLIVPLLISRSKDSGDILGMSPEGLEESEKQFILKLDEYLRKSKLLDDYEVYMIRNFPFKGVGFQLESCGFYPDFVVWFINKKTGFQTILFVEPHALFFEKVNIRESEKVNFIAENPKECFVNIKDIERKLKDSNLRLEGFMLATTTLHELSFREEVPVSEIEKMLKMAEIVRGTSKALF